VQQHRSLRRIVKARHQVGSRSLAAAGRADQRISLPAFHLKADVAQNFFPIRIMKPHLAEGENGLDSTGPAASITGKFDSSASTSEIRSNAAMAIWKRRPHRGQLPQRAIEVVHIKQKTNEQTEA
jgi:hypothetical protein